MVHRTHGDMRFHASAPDTDAGGDSSGMRRGDDSLFPQYPRYRHKCGVPQSTRDISGGGHFREATYLLSTEPKTPSKAIDEMREEAMRLISNR